MELKQNLGKKSPAERIFFDRFLGAVKTEIENRELSYYRIAQDTGISSAALSRFRRPGGSIKTESLILLLDYLGIDLVTHRGTRVWESEESFTDKDRAVSPAVSVEEPGRVDDISQWTSSKLASEILHAEAESDMPRLREMIFVAEDTDFSVDQDSQLAPWLLRFAERCRDSDDPQDEVAVWSAIRTGASMLTPDAADALLPLLQPGHSIETSLVAVKMVGRIFEAQPPTDVDQHGDLAEEVCRIAEALLNPYAITISKSAAMAHLAIYALAAMASRETPRIVEIARQLDTSWFTRQAYHDLSELRRIWINRSAAVSDRPLALLNRAIETLGTG